MLSGLRDQVESMFPSISGGLLPDEQELKDGEERARLGRLVELSGYHTRIFDMSAKREAADYDALMLDLTRRVQTGEIRILVHDRQIMHRKDGSTGWYGYLEWMEYKRTESDVGAPEKQEGK